MNPINWIEKIFLYSGDPATPGLSQDLFFTKIYFWLFLGVVMFFMWLIHKTKNTAILISLVSATLLGFLYITIYSPSFLIIYFLWAFFAFFFIYYAYEKKTSLACSTFLFATSLFFYYKSGGAFFLILIFTTVINYFLGIAIYSAEKKLKKKILITTSIVVNMIVLSFFKYAYFFSDSFQVFLQTLNHVFRFDFLSQWNLNLVLEQWSKDSLGKGFTFSRIILPIGISFFTFQAMSYTIDIYRGKLEPLRNIMHFGFFVSFFPQLVMGPIVRAAHFIPQIYKPYKLTKVQFGTAIFWILNGLLKKAFLADFIANGFIDYSFQNPEMSSGFQCLIAILGYSLQVYADFSGYTDMAIGIGLLLGFSFNQNFNSPYKAKNVGDFWKRWHISLSTWLRDYLYIPLGGNKKGSLASYIVLAVMLLIMLLLSKDYWKQILLAAWTLGGTLLVLSLIFKRVKKQINTNVNLMITMLLGGLWHGANWNMVIWGGLNGLGLIVYKLWRKISPYEKSNAAWSNTIKIIFTLTFISFTRIFFRSDDMEIATNFIDRIIHHFHPELIGQVISEYWFYYSILILGYSIHLIPSKQKTMYRNWFIRSHIVVKGGIIVFAAIMAYQSLQSSQPFIYFSF
ncbi:MAG: MBOAT family protein [Flavobacteriales bacterium]|nr:MBOAT family protein [Flavobacteriales bacterium]